MSMSTISARGSAQQSQAATAAGAPRTSRPDRPHEPLGTGHFGGPKSEYEARDIERLSDDGISAFFSANADLALSNWTITNDSFVVPLLGCYARALELGIDLDISDYQRLASLSPGDECDAVVARLEAAALQAQAVNHHAEPPGPNRHVPDDQMAAYLARWRVLPGGGRTVSDVMYGLASNDYNKYLRIFARALDLGFPIQVGDPRYIGNRQDGAKLSTLLRFLKAARIDVATVEWKNKPLTSKLVLPSTTSTSNSTPTTSTSSPSNYNSTPLNSTSTQSNSKPTPVQQPAPPTPAQVAAPPVPQAFKGKELGYAALFARTESPKQEQASLDAVLSLADLRDQGIKTAAQARKLFKEAGARQVPVQNPDGNQEQEAWAFPDGSVLSLRASAQKALELSITDNKGRRPVLDQDSWDLFHLPISTDAGAASAALTARLLRASDARQQLEDRGFTAVSARYFVHQDGSWAVIAPSASSSTRVAAGIGARRFDMTSSSLTAAVAARENVLAALPAWLRPMIKLSPPGQDIDLQLLAHQLAALDERMLAALQQAGYTLHVTRFRVSNAQADLKDETITGGGSGQFLVDLAEGVHRHGGGVKPSITVKTYLVDGQLRIDLSTLIHEIGHAFDLVVDSTTPQNALNVRAGSSGKQRKDPLHLEPEFADAFAKEHTRLPQYFHTQPEFMAESFALYMLDPLRCKRQLPLTFAALDKHFKAIAAPPDQLLALEQAFDRPAIVIPQGQDLRKQLAFSAQQNRVLRDAGIPAHPMVIHLDGKADWGTEAYVADAARAVRNAFGKDAGVYRSQENLVKLTPAQFNNAADVEAILTEIETSGRPAVLFIPDAAQIQKTSAGFAVIDDFISRHRDVPPLVIAGEQGALRALDGAIPSAARLGSKIEPLTAQHQVELVERLAAQDSFLLTPGVSQALGQKLKGGGYEAAAEAWRAVKAAQFERHLKKAEQSNAVSSLTELREILPEDIAAMKVSTKKTPQERLADMVGQKLAKDQIDAITKQAKVSALRAQEGLPDPARVRLNLLFSGSPGTGKTTFAEILGALLQEIGYIKNPTVTKVTIQDLLSGSPEATVKALFEQNRGGVIFLDEMHQLQDTAEGKRAFRAMIPYLADAAYADTVFIGAGYSDELGSLIRDVDPGAERRFTTVPFIDFKREELGKILDFKVKDVHLTMDEKTRDAALGFLDHRKRITKNFGNAGEIDIALGHAQKAQTLRIADLPASKITAQVLMQLLPEDFSIPKPITKEEFWAEMDQMSGWSDIKAQLKQMAASIEGAVKRGKAPTDAVEPYWIIDGPPGTGKTTLARMLSKFGAAYGLTAVPEVVDVQGANFQGEYVGQTAGIVQKQFEKAWGRLMFVDEVSGLAKSGGDFKFEAAKMILAQTENHRGKFMMVIADYAENINQFLKLDPGLPRRFGNRITLQPWTPQEATADLVKKLKEEGIDLSGLAPVFEKLFAELSKIPGYASGGDVRSLKVAIMALLDATPDADTQEALKNFAELAFSSLIEKKKKDAGPSSQNPESSAPVASAVATATKTEEKSKPTISLTKHDEKVLKAFDNTNQALGAKLNGLTAEQLSQIESDPNSEFAKKLAEQLKTTPEEAVKVLHKVKVKVKKLVQVKKQELMQRFVYHCPYCGGIDSPRCGYINYPIEWKMEHSLKKPWTEVKETTTTEEIEVTEERIQER